MDLIMDQHQISIPNILSIIHSTATLGFAALLSTALAMVVRLSMASLAMAHFLSMANMFHNMAIIQLVGILSMPRIIRMGRIRYFFVFWHLLQTARLQKERLAVQTWFYAVNSSMRKSDLSLPSTSMHHCLVITILCRAMDSIMDQVQSMVVTELQSMVIDHCKILWLQGVSCDIG